MMENISLALSGWGMSTVQPQIIQSQPIKIYTDPLKSKRIEVLMHDDLRLDCRIHELNSKGEEVFSSDFVPLSGLPKQIGNSKDIGVLTHFFQETYFVAEKGIEGTYNRVSVRGKLKGGMKPKIPFQPGLVLGSIVKGDSIDQVEKYADTMAKNDRLKEQIDQAENRIEALQSKIKSKSNDDRPTQKKLIELWEKEIKSLEGYIERVTKELDKIYGEQQEIPIFSGVHQGIEAPFDFAHSKIDVQETGFDSLTYNSQYINLKSDTSSINDMIEQSSKAYNVSAGVSFNAGLWNVGGSVSHTHSQAIADRVAKIKSENRAEGVLMINAFATTRFVRRFSAVKFDKKKLKSILDIMKSNDAEEMRRCGITVRSNGSKAIYVLSEVSLGGSYTALVTILDEHKMQRNAQKHMQASGNQTSADLHVSYGMIGSLDASFARSAQSGKQQEEDLINTIGQTRVNIEVISQGVVPTFEKEKIEHEIKKHLNLDPSQYELNQNDEDEAKILMNGNKEEKAIAICKRQMRMEKSQVASLNAIRAMSSENHVQNIHTPSSIMDGYDQFAKKLASDKGCGIPIGFGYQVYEQKHLETIYQEMEQTHG